MKNPKFKTRKIYKPTFGSILLSILKFMGLRALFLLGLLISYSLKLTIYLCEQCLFLLSILLAKKDVGIKIEIDDGEIPDDQFTRKFSDEDIVKMAIKVKRKFGESITRKMIEDFCDISSRQADRIREILPKIPNIQSNGAV